ncbi:MAG TPA: LacI family DNA-binding transcriptional regulator [Casimicrobiaceae bacterium]|nr:LacI family DNA-binding transcriptional regulator [Casimicrobiaceae bacterium]
MADVARLAGVSSSTVSRALRHADAVSPALRARVAAAIDSLGYVPNSMAGGLAAARTRTVGVIVPSLVNSFFSATLEAMAEALSQHDYQILFGNSGYAPEREEALVHSFLAWSPAAIVLTGRAHTRDTLKRLVAADIPVVEMWEVGDNAIDTVVGFSHRHVGRAAARHLLERGRKHLAFVGAALDLDRRAAQRCDGFFDVLHERGDNVQRAVALPERASADGGARALSEIVKRHPDTDAVFFSNDVLMLGGLFACQRLGIDVPRSLALIGFGDLDFTASSRPSLTTLRPPRREIGVVVARHLIERFEDANTRSTAIDLGFELVQREST